jgi:hypothetical protein
MLVVWGPDSQDSGPEVGTALLPLQLLLGPATVIIKGGGKWNGLDGGQMQTRADL